MVNQERAQPEGGSTIRGGAKPQYLTLADVNDFLEQEREKLSRIPHSHHNSLASFIPRDMNPQNSILLMEEMEVLWSM